METMLWYEVMFYLIGIGATVCAAGALLLALWRGRGTYTVHHYDAVYPCDTTSYDRGVTTGRMEAREEQYREEMEQYNKKRDRANEDYRIKRLAREVARDEIAAPAPDRPR